MPRTPGKWKAEPHRMDGNSEFTDCSVHAEEVPGHAHAVAICPRYQTKAQWEADSLLIESAPLLLQALRDIVQANPLARFTTDQVRLLLKLENI